MQKPSWLKTTFLLHPFPLCWRLLTLNEEWASSGSQKKNRGVKPHFPFFHLSPGNESPDNTHTFGPGNWKAPVRLQDARPYWLWAKKGPRRHYSSFKVKDGAFLVLLLFAPGCIESLSVELILAKALRTTEKEQIGEKPYGINRVTERLNLEIDFESICQHVK